MNIRANRDWPRIVRSMASLVTDVILLSPMAVAAIRQARRAGMLLRKISMLRYSEQVSLTMFKCRQIHATIIDRSMRPLACRRAC
jgi:hypothetical protein